MRLETTDNQASRLLKRYLEILHEDPTSVTPLLRHLAVIHVHELVAIALTAKRDRSTEDNGHGVRAARLRVIKSDILEHLSDPELTVTTVAHRQGITPRYIHMLFASEGITFSRYVLSQRLAESYRMLFDPGLASMSVTAIAFAVGFGDLSYFNRTFRHRYGATPSELRRENRLANRYG